MRKKVFSITIALFLIFGAATPSFAQIVQVEEFQGSGAWNDNAHTVGGYTFANSIYTTLNSVATRVYNCYTRLGTIVTALTDNSNSYILTNMLTQIQKLTHIADQFDFFLGSNGSTAITENWSEFTDDFYRMCRWLAPSSGLPNAGGNNFLTMWDYMYYVAQEVFTLWGGWDTEFSNLTGIHSDTTNIATYTSPLRFGITNHYRGEITLSTYMKQVNGHSYLLGDDGKYTMPYYDSHGVISTPASITWQNGTPIGNVAAILKLGFGQVTKLNGFMVGYFDDTLSIWDSQGNTLTQETWTPKSAINGLYKYLAYTQRDVARLAHVYASDEEIAARDKAKTNQTAVVNTFVDSNGSGAAAVSDFNAVGSQSSDFQDNFSTNVSAGSIWNVFNVNQWGWFSNSTIAQLDTTPQTRNESDYATPLLDAYYSEMLRIVEGDLDESR